MYPNWLFKRLLEYYDNNNSLDYYNWVLIFNYIFYKYNLRAIIKSP